MTFHDSPRRAHSIAAQGGINAAKNYKNDGDSVQRLFYDTVKGGDYRSREANVYRLAQVSVNIIDQCAAQGVPFAREYGGLLDNRSFGGAQVSRTFYARGQTGQQLLLGAYQALAHQIALGAVTLYDRTEMLDLVVKDGRAAGITCRDLVTGEVFGLSGARGRARDRRLRQRLLPLHQRDELQRHRRVAGVEEGRVLREPLLHADPPHVHPGERRLPVEAHADVGVTAQRRPHLGAREDGRPPLGRPDPRSRSATTSSSAATPRSATSCRATSRRAPRSARSTPVAASGPLKNGVYLDFAEAIGRLGEHVDQGALQQPLRDVRPHHRRRSVPHADAHLPRRPLHDGRALGRLQPAEQPPGPVRARRGELLRPRREPARRLGAHAGPRRRLLRPPGHDRRLPRAAARAEAGAHRRPGVHGVERRRSTTRCARCSRTRARSRSTTTTASSARSCGTTAAWREPSRASRRR